MTTLTTAQARALLIRLLARIAPEVDLVTARPGEDLQQELGLDSMDFLDLMIGIHDETGYEVPERDYPALATLERALAYLTEHVPA